MPPSPYRDLARPPLREASLRRGLVVPGGVWTHLQVVAETGSTNADAAAAARSGAGEGLVIVAEAQRTGRGRLDRSWVAPPQSSILVSVLLRPGVAPARLGWLPLLAGVALAESVGRVAGVEVALKWPNDLLVRPAGASEAGYGKCAGVLAEVVDGKADGPVVLGIGLNVSQRAEELPPDRAGGLAATSLVLAGAAVLDRDPILRALLRALARWYERWRGTGGDADACGLRAAYRSVCLTLGTAVQALLPNGRAIAGSAIDVDTYGRLIIDGVDGHRGPQPLAAGDVIHVRPA